MMQTLLVQKQTDPIGETLQKKIFEFFEEYKVSPREDDYFMFEDENQLNSEEEYVLLYKKQLENMKALDKRTMYVDLRHLIDFDTSYELRELIFPEYYRFEHYLNAAVGDFMRKYYYEFAEGKTYYLSFYNVPTVEKLRELRTSKIGKLISICGTITRTSEVKPELISGSFICKACGTLVRNIQQQFRYSEPQMCTNQNCTNRRLWEISLEDSLLADWQKLRVQENPTDIPPGSMPRSIDVVLRNEQVESCKPGDKCNFTGCLLVVPDIFSLTKPGEKVQHEIKRDTVRKNDQKNLDGVTGLKNLGIRDMSYKMIFVAQYVQFLDMKYNPLINNKVEEEENINKFTSKEKQQFIAMKNESDIYSKLTKCIAPSVYGHEEVKKGILLMLFGGTNKSTEENIKLRGDVNICIVGDPSTAKSQFLKYVCQLLPRAVYTSGKGSSAAGLTASVLKDSDTGEFCIEAGALMLADNGICCIDEFDKMDQKDQVAIHEAMEQQTISIAKAGIQATLMARTSILAASNPVMGRYDKTKSLRYNVDISAPIMSRFDLFFVIVDESEQFVDYNIAKHITLLHQNYTDGIDDSLKPPFTQEQMLSYIRFAKTLRPKFSKEAAETLRKKYNSLRFGDVTAEKSAYRITVRQLESLIRISEALARVHLEEWILRTHVEEAARLLETSIIKVDSARVEIDDFEENLVRDRKRFANNSNEDVMMVDAEEGEGRTLKKLVMTNAEFENIKQTVIFFMKELEKEEMNPKHKDLVEYYVEQHLQDLDNPQQAEEMTKKVNAVIENMINKEGILIVNTENDDKTQRVLSLNVNYDAPLFS